MVFRLQGRTCQRSSCHAQTLTGFVFLQSITQSFLAESPQQFSSSHGIRFPTAQVRSEGPLVRSEFQPIFVPPSGFGYPLGDFLPSHPSESYFGLTALVGFTLRSTRHPCKVLQRLRRNEPTCRFRPQIIRRPLLSAYGPANRSSWVVTLAGRPDRNMRAYDPGQPASLGFSFLGFSRSPALIFLPEDLLSCA